MAATQSACTRRGRLKAVELGAHGERTRNMYPIFVMLDVSKLSGWLNFVAPCRDSKDGDTMRSGMHGDGLSLDWGPGHASHPDHLFHGRDLGRVEAELLVER